jgi:cysteine desulfuration protein SufE
MSLQTIKDDFAFLDEWEDRYRYVIELGRALEPLRAEEKTEATKVRGCASQVWLVIDPPTGPDGGPARFHFRGESDAHIVQGLIAILKAIYDGQPVGEVGGIDATAILADLGLSDHLTPQRSNGLKSMVERIRSEAQALKTS